MGTEQVGPLDIRTPVCRRHPLGVSHTRASTDNPPMELWVPAQALLVCFPEKERNG
jgi:hypothetical protein